MALRPIDNALPSAQERPKKQAKVSAPIRKQTELVANDENKAPAVENAEASVDYIASEYLKPVQEPDSKIQVSLSSFCLFVFLSFLFNLFISEFSQPAISCQFQSLIEGLDSKDWLKLCESLNDTRRFALYHSDLLVPSL